MNVKSSILMNKSDPEFIIIDALSNFTFILNLNMKFILFLCFMFHGMLTPFSFTILQEVLQFGSIVYPSFVTDFLTN
jgi:hypothetical protein